MRFDGIILSLNKKRSHGVVSRIPWIRRVIGGGAIGFLVLLAGCMEVPGETSRFSAEVSARYPIRTGPHSATEPPSFPAGVDVLDGVEEEEAVRTALWNNAQVLEALSDLGLTRADVVAAEMIPNPTLSVLVPVGAKPFELVARYPLEFLWLRPKRVALARMEHERNSERLVQVALDLIRDVRVAFTEVVLAHQQTTLNGSLADLMKESATLAGSLTRAGESSELESMVARNESHQASERVDRMRFDEAALRERLHLLLGLGMVPLPDLRLGDPPPSLEMPELAKVLSLALTNRPDLRASELAVEAAGRRIGLARNEALQWAASVSSKEVNGEPMPGPGLDVTLPIFNRNEGPVAQAQARFEKVSWQRLTNRNRILLEVREACLRLEQSQRSADRWRQEILPPLEEAVHQAESAFSAGNVGRQAILQSRRRLLEARIRSEMALGDLRRAAAELERSVGRRVPPESRPPTLSSP